MTSEVGIGLFRSGCAAGDVELDLQKTQRRGDLGARRAPDEAQERPSLASGTAPEGGPGSEVCKSGQVVQIEPRAGPSWRPWNPLPGPLKRHGFLGPEGYFC